MLPRLGPGVDNESYLVRALCACASTKTELVVSRIRLVRRQLNLMECALVSDSLR